MAKVAITQVRSVIKRPARQKDTMRSLGLTRIGRTVEFELTPVVQGMIDRVAHLVKVEEVN